MRIQARLAAKRPKGEAAADVEIDPKLVEAQLEDDPEIQKQKRHRRQFDSMIRAMKKQFNSDRHPAVIEAESQFAEMEAELDGLRQKLKPLVEEELRQQRLKDQTASVSELKHQAEVLTSQFESIEKELDAQKVESHEIGLSSYQLEVQKQRIAETEEMADQIKQRIRQIEVELDAQPRVDVFHKAEVPHTPMVARKIKLMAVAGLGGFGLVASLILWLDLLSNRISSIVEVVHGLKLPILGTLPIMPRGLIQGQNTKKSGRPQALLGLWKESIDSTRAMLLSQTATRGHREHQTIMVTSAMSGEGKTTLACHLAISLAQSGRKTLLIDADLRRPAIHQVFGIPGSPGLSDVLRQKADLAHVIQRHSIKGFSILPAGEVDPQALQMLAADAAGPLLKELRADYDFIVVDSAPVLPVTDALMIGPHADGALFAVRRDVSRRRKISSACERLERVGISLLGAVVIGLDSQEPADRYTPYASQYVEPEFVTRPTAPAES